jgi:hypothetical protein
VIANNNLITNWKIISQSYWQLLCRTLLFETRRKSARFRVGAKFEPLSGLLPTGLRFLRHPITRIPISVSRDSPARGREYGLTTFHVTNFRGLGAVFGPALLHPRWSTRETPSLNAYHFGLGLTASLAH